VDVGEGFLMQDDLDRLGDALSEDRLDLETGGIGFRI
jgi:hypothetical protein